MVSVVLSLVLFSIHMFFLWRTKLHIAIKIIATGALLYILYNHLYHKEHFESSVTLVQETDPKIEQQSLVLYELYQKYNNLLNDYRNLRTNCQRTVLNHQEKLRNALAEIYKIDSTPINMTYQPNINNIIDVNGTDVNKADITKTDVDNMDVTKTDVDNTDVTKTAVDKIDKTDYVNYDMNKNDDCENIYFIDL